MLRERRIAFLVYDLIWADTSDGVLPFSYGARTLEASLRGAPDLADTEVKIIELRSNDVQAYFEQIREFRPTLVAASTYIWSVKLFTELAELVKRWDPSVRFIMGGPAARPTLLNLSPYAPYLKYIDAVATGEGEEVIRHVARNHLADDWIKTTPGLTVPGPLGWRRTELLDRPVLDAYPSPYQLGIVPFGEKGFLETFRGCPINCAFCQWGEERADRVYSAEYIAEHLRGIEAAGVTAVYVVDAGFNLSARAFRNLVKAEKEVGALRHRKMYGHVYPTYIREEHLEFFDAIGNAEIAVGVQSFDKQALRRLGRPFDIARFERALEEIKRHSSVSLELILGLPGDDPAAFRHTFEKSITLADSLRVFYCLALPDALLDRAAEFDLDFDPVTFEVRRCQGWTWESLQTEWEYVREVARSMPRASFGPNWIEFRTTERAASRSQGAHRGAVGNMGRRMAPETLEVFRRRVAGHSAKWTISDGWLGDDWLELEVSKSANEVEPLWLVATRARDGEKRFTEVEGIAYSYRGNIARTEVRNLQEVIQSLHRSVGESLGARPASD